MKKLLLILLLFPSLTFAIDSIDDLSVVSHWTCDETSGVRYDSNITNSNDFTDNNTVLYATGLRGNACDFESSNSEYLTIANADQTGLDPQRFTISYWFKLESDVWGYIFNQNKNSSDLVYQSGYANNPPIQLHGGANVAGVNKSIAGTATLSTGVWYHLVLTFDESKLRIYRDGQLEASTTASGALSYGTLEVNLGRLPWAGRYFDGLVDEITFDDSVWSDEDVLAVYNSGTPLPYTFTATTSSSTATTTSSSVASSDLLFMLAVIIFFLTFIWFGHIMSVFRKK